MKVDRVTASWGLLLLAGASAYNGAVAFAFHQPSDAAARFILAAVFVGAWFWARRQALREERRLAVREERKRRDAQGS